MASQHTHRRFPISPQLDGQGSQAAATEDDDLGKLLAGRRLDARELSMETQATSST
jgi:hypothetical protein